MRFQTIIEYKKYIGGSNDPYNSSKSFADPVEYKAIVGVMDDKKENFSFSDIPITIKGILDPDIDADKIVLNGLEYSIIDYRIINFKALTELVIRR